MWGCFLMSGVKILHFLKDWWKSIPIHQNYTMALAYIREGGCIWKEIFCFDRTSNEDLGRGKILIEAWTNTVEPRYKEVGYNKPCYNKVILLVPALYISLCFYPDITRNLI